MVLYALVSDQSVGYLFAAGMMPGLLMGFALILMNGIIAHRRGFERDQAIALHEIPGTTIRAFPALMLPVILLGGIYGGIMTPTEAAAVAAFYALLISTLVYRSVSAGQFFRTLLASARSTATVGILIAGALTFQYVVTRENVPNALADWRAQYELGRTGFLIAINVLFLALGCILESGAILLIIVPICIPSVQALGIDLVHFGVIVVVNAMLGLITPPYGLLLFIVAAITRAPMGRIVRDLLPFIGVLLIALAIITFVPEFVLWLPRLLGYKG
jgi:tripartite ATP-independent transporter DctM subunit